MNDWITRRNQWLIGASLAVITFVLFFPVIHHEFLNYDDNRYVTANAFVMNGFSWNGVKFAFTKGYASNWHPLTWLSHMLDSQLYGLKPAGHHLTNLLFHTANVVLLFCFLQKLTGKVWRSAMVAALFAWHPLHIESVAWVAERKDVLSTFFGLLSLGAYVRYVETTRAQTTSKISTKSALWFLVALGLFVLGLMSKPMLVTLPCVLLLLDYWPLNRFSVEGQALDKWSAVKLVWEKIPFLILSVVSCAITYRVQQAMGAMTLMESLSLGARITNAVMAYALYLRDLFYPVKLAVFYPLPEAWATYQVFIAVVVLLTITVAACMQRRQRPYFLIGWLWFLGTLVPVIGLIQVGTQSRADRYTYLPFIGLFIALVWCMADALAQRFSRMVPGVLASVVLVACAAMTTKQLDYWQDSSTLFTRALEVTKNNAVANNNIGTLLSAKGDHEGALKYYLEAARINPRFYEPHANMGNAYAKLNQLPKAVAEFEIALQILPDIAVGHLNLAMVLTSMNQLDKAAEQFKLAIHYNPTDPIALYNYGVVLNRLNRTNEGIAQLKAALVLKPNFTAAHQALAEVYSLSGQPAEAIGQYQDAVRDNPNSARAHSELGVALGRQQKFAEAAEQFEVWVRLEPENPDAHYNLGNALLAQNKFAQAAVQYTEVLRISPNDAGAQAKLARCRARL